MTTLQIIGLIAIPIVFGIIFPIAGNKYRDWQYAKERAEAAKNAA